MITELLLKLLEIAAEKCYRNYSFIQKHNELNELRELLECENPKDISKGGLAESYYLGSKWTDSNISETDEVVSYITGINITEELKDNDNINCIALFGIDSESKKRKLLSFLSVDCVMRIMFTNSDLTTLLPISELKSNAYLSIGNFKKNDGAIHFENKVKPRLISAVTGADADLQFHLTSALTEYSKPHIEDVKIDDLVNLYDENERENIKKFIANFGGLLRLLKCEIEQEYKDGKNHTLTNFYLPLPVFEENNEVYMRAISESIKIRYLINSNIQQSNNYINYIYEHEALVKATLQAGKLSIEEFEQAFNIFKKLNRYRLKGFELLLRGNLMASAAVKDSAEEIESAIIMFIKSSKDDAAKEKLKGKCEEAMKKHASVLGTHLGIPFIFLNPLFFGLPLYLCSKFHEVTGKPLIYTDTAKKLQELHDVDIAAMCRSPR